MTGQQPKDDNAIQSSNEHLAISDGRRHELVSLAETGTELVTAAGGLVTVVKLV